MNVRLIFGIGLVALLLAGVAVGAASFARSQQVSYSLATPAPIGRASPPPPPPTMPPTAPPTDAPQVNVAAAGGGIAQSPVPSATATPEPTGVVASASGALMAGEQATAQPSASPVPTGAVAEGGGGVVTERQPSAATVDPARDSAAPFALSNATDAHAQGASNQAATQPSSQPRPSVSFIDGLPPIVWATLALALLALVGGGMLQRRRKGGRGTRPALAPLGGLAVGQASPPAPTPAAAPAAKRRSPLALLSGLRLPLPRRAAPTGAKRTGAATGALAPLAPAGAGAPIAFDLGQSDMRGLLDDDATAPAAEADLERDRAGFEAPSAPGAPFGAGDFSFDVSVVSTPEAAMTPTVGYDADATAFDWADMPLAPSLPASGSASSAIAPQPDALLSFPEQERTMHAGDSVFAPATPGLADPPAAAPAAPEASSLALEMPESALTLGPALPPAVAPSPLPPPAALDRQIVLKYVRQV